MDFHIKDLATSHKSYLQDTPDFIRKIEHINTNHKLSQNAMLVTLDAIALYTNIPQHEGAQATEHALNERENQSIPREYILSMLKIILKNNIFTFNEKYYILEEGTSMGPMDAPHYTDIFMSRNIDPHIEELFKYMKKKKKIKFHDKIFR